MAAWITARQASRLYGVQLGTVYAWASQDNWRRTPHKRGSIRPIEYCWEDAQASYEKRHGVPQAS